MSRPRVEVSVPALALRRAEAAAALAVSLETFDQHIRPHVAAVPAGTVVLYPVAELQRFLTENARGYDGSHNKSGAARW
jgi:hypothetical protein